MSLNNAIKFLKNGDKVRLVLTFKGREMAHTDLGNEVLIRFSNALSDVASIDQKPNLDGRFMTMILMPIKK